MLDQVEEAGLDVVSLDEVVRRLREDDARRFVCFTFDQGYLDALRHAYPLFQRRSLPLTLDIATDYASGWGELWWLALEEVITRAREIELCRHGELWRLPAATAQEKQRSFEQIYGWLRSVDEATQRQVARALADRYDIDMSATCHDLMMSWGDIRRLAADPLVTIGTHSKAHYAIAKLSPEKAVSEMEGSAEVIERELGTRPIHLSFPYGDEGAARARDFALAKELGFKTAMTTRKGSAVPRTPSVSNGAAAGLAQRRLSILDLYGALSLRRTLRTAGLFPAGQRRLIASSRSRSSGVRPLHPTN